MSSSTTTPPNAEDIIASPAVNDDLNAEMRDAAKPFSRTTLVLAGLVVLAIAFGGGAWTHAAFGSSSPSTPTRPAGGTPGGQQAGAGQQGGGFRGGRGTTGTVDRVDGTTVYVKTAQGTDVKVSTSDATTVGVTQQGKLADLKPGATVVVQGQAGSDGTVTAQAITQEAGR